MPRLIPEIKINIKDEDTDPVSSVSVTLTDADGNDTTEVSDESGVATFTDLEEGTYGVKAELEGYVTYNDSKEFTVDSATADIVLEAVIPVIEQIHVTVKNASEEALEGATVTFTNSELLPEPIVRTTGSAGGCNFDNIKVGTYTVTCTMTGYTDYSASVAFDEDDTSYDISMTAAEE